MSLINADAQQDAIALKSQQKQDALAKDKEKLESTFAATIKRSFIGTPTKKKESSEPSLPKKTTDAAGIAQLKSDVATTKQEVKPVKITEDERRKRAIEDMKINETDDDRLEKNVFMDNLRRFRNADEDEWYDIKYEKQRAAEDIKRLASQQQEQKDAWKIEKANLLATEKSDSKKLDLTTKQTNEKFIAYQDAKKAYDSEVSKRYVKHVMDQHFLPKYNNQQAAHEARQNVNSYKKFESTVALATKNNSKSKSIEAEKILEKIKSFDAADKQRIYSLMPEQDRRNLKNEIESSPLIEGKPFHYLAWDKDTQKAYDEYKAADAVASKAQSEKSRDQAADAEVKFFGALRKEDIYKNKVSKNIAAEKSLENEKKALIQQYEKRKKDASDPSKNSYELTQAKAKLAAFIKENPDAVKDAAAIDKILKKTPLDVSDLKQDKENVEKLKDEHSVLKNTEIELLNKLEAARQAEEQRLLEKGKSMGEIGDILQKREAQPPRPIDSVFQVS